MNSRMKLDDSSERVSVLVVATGALKMEKYSGYHGVF